ncbi:MAG: helix-turn-helix transcriptional regulator [Clostridia bacterium]|nr:helix-turn-helix transcriptional regulator [Clostridia bacterium]
MELTIGTNIKRLRTAKNITQEQLSEAMNVTCAAVSKWERGDTYPDITLLQPLAYYFGVTLDELMGYDQEKIQAKIDDVIALYRKYWNSDYKKAREIITKAYHDYPNDYWIMHYYMWNIGGDMADNDPAVLIAHKDEFLAICDKILGGCTEESLRLGAWNMRAKILHAEGKTEEALEIYKTKFTDWYTTGEQKTEQLFAKDTSEYYFHVQKNMYELIDFAADKLGRTVFFDSSLSMQEKTKRALCYGDLMLNAFEKTGEAFFLMLAKSFLGRMENDLTYRGGADDQVITVMDKNLYATKKLEELRTKNKSLDHACDRYSADARENLFVWNLNYRANATGGRRAELLKNPAYVEVLNKYK